jgi:parallel beta-helix repeat protein
MRKLIISLATLLGVMGVGLVAGPAAMAGATGGGGTLFVSPTGTDVSLCRIAAHPCKTITYALSQAPASSLIKVAAGTYPEQVVINGAALDNVTIEGAGASSTTIEPSTLPVGDTDTDSSAVQDAIIDVHNATGVTVEGLTVNGAAAQSTFTGCAVDYVGTYFHDASGTLSKVTVTNVELPAGLFGCQQGQAIYADSDPTSASSLTMTKVTVSNIDKNGITCDDLHTTCTISGSTVTGGGPINTTAQNGIQVYGASATLTKDTVGSFSYTGGGADATGILVIDAGTFSLTNSKANADDVGAYLLEDAGFQLSPSTTEGTWTATGNTADQSPNNGGGSPGEGFGDGIDVDSTTAPVTVSNNKVENDAGFGIGLYGPNGATVSNNTAKSDFNGIYLGAGSVAAVASNNAITSNKALSNSNDGILADSPSSGNTFTSNSLRTNTLWDAQDLSTGAGTAGTANTWHTNVCGPAHDGTPAGVC